MKPNCTEFCKESFFQTEREREKHRERKIGESTNQKLLSSFTSIQNLLHSFSIILFQSLREWKVSGRFHSQSEWVVVSNKGKKIELVSTLSLSLTLL